MDRKYAKPHLVAKKIKEVQKISGITNLKAELSGPLGGQFYLNLSAEEKKEINSYRSENFADLKNAVLARLQTLQAASVAAHAGTMDGPPAEEGGHDSDLDHLDPGGVPLDESAGESFGHAAMDDDAPFAPNSYVDEALLCDELRKNNDQLRADKTRWTIEKTQLESDLRAIYANYEQVADTLRQMQAGALNDSEVYMHLHEKTRELEACQARCAQLHAQIEQVNGKIQAYQRTGIRDVVKLKAYVKLIHGDCQRYKSELSTLEADISRLQHENCQLKMCNTQLEEQLRNRTPTDLDPVSEEESAAIHAEIAMKFPNRDTTYMDVNEIFARLELGV